MMILNPDNVIEDSLATGFVLPTYLQIMEAASRKNFHATSEFRKKYNGFYKVRSKQSEWYDRYYDLMERQRESSLSFEELLRRMYEVNASVEVSFVSKLIATIDPSRPIWDQYVLKNLGLWSTWDKSRIFPYEKRIELADKTYRIICEWYREFMCSEDGKACIERFDAALPHYRDKVSDVKKIDFFLWAKR